MMCVKKTGRIAAVLAAALICCGCGEKEVQQNVSEETQGAVSEAEESAEGEESAEAEDSAGIQAAADTQESAGDRKEAMTIEEVYQEIEQEVSLQSPKCMDEDFIFNYYGIDAAVLEEYVFSISEDAAQAETIIIMKVTDDGDLEEIASCLEAVVEEKKEEMENYIPEQFEIVEKSEVVTKDHYVWLVISENEDAVTDIIENGLL